MYTAFVTLLKKLSVKPFLIIGGLLLILLSVYSTNFFFTQKAEAGNGKNLLRKSQNTVTPTFTPTPTSSTSDTSTTPTATPMAPTSTPTATPLPTNTPTPTTAVQTQTNFKVGVVVDGYSNSTGELSTLSSQLGKPISTISIFKQFGSIYNNSFKLEDLSYAKSQNMKVNVAWEPWNPSQGMNQSIDYLKEIPLGKHDAYLQSFASSVKTYASPVEIRFGHEMNGNWYPWGNRPSEYITAYRYIVNYFRNQEVQNVKWMWAINADNVPYTPISNAASFYPGDDVVDSIGIDGYNFGGSNWKSFSSIFSSAYSYISTTYPSKPITIAETASSETGGNKASWIYDMFKNTLPSVFPKISELTWFNLIKENDWRINSSDTSLQSFKTNMP